MDAISKYHDLKIIHGWYVCILKLYFILTLFTSLIEIYSFLTFFCARLQGTTKKVFMADAI
jgi:hypothetical protein